MRLPYISIIIPIYQVEDFVEECLNSIASQTYQGKLECILIDDCGKDKSILISQKFINRYSGPIIFRIIGHKSNKGLSAARNTGLLAAEGEYVIFVDSDDTITPDCIDSLANCLTANDIDMICGAFKVTEGYRKWWSDGYRLPQFYSTDKNRIIRFYSGGYLYEMSWNKQIRKNILIDNQLFFKEGIYHEDKLWSLLIINHISSLQTIDKVTYYYRQQGNSIMWNKKNEIKRLYDRIIIQEEFDKLLKNGTIPPIKNNIFRIRMEKNLLGKDIVKCKSLSFIKKISFFTKLICLSGRFHFIYAMMKGSSQETD